LLSTIFLPSYIFKETGESVLIIIALAITSAAAILYLTRGANYRFYFLGAWFFIAITCLIATISSIGMDKKMQKSTECLINSKCEENVKIYRVVFSNDKQSSDQRIGVRRQLSWPVNDNYPGRF
jgi:hypothetical protein